MKWQVHKFDVLDTTQGYLRDLVNVNHDIDEGYLVQAEKQTNGYGRHGRDWQEGSGNLYTSFLVRPECTAYQIGELSLLTGVALANTIKQYLEDIPTLLKWPNDILIEHKKCSGILIDAGSIEQGIIPYLIIGVGVNIKTAPLKETSALQEHMNTTLNTNDFLSGFLIEFSKLYAQWQQSGFVTIRTLWIQNSFPAGTHVKVKINDNHISGKFQTIDNTGSLVITCDKTHKTKTITAGDVFINE